MIETYIREQIYKLIPVPIPIKCGERFIYWNDGINEVVNFTIEDFDPEIDEIFRQYITETYGVDMKKYDFIFSLLHEIGHYMTIEQVDIISENYLRELIHQTETDLTKIQYAYFNLESERLANDWAYWYFTSCFDECKRFTKKVLPLIKFYYKDKEITNYVLVKG